MSTDIPTQRILSDIQSSMSRLDYRVQRMSAGADTSRAGNAFFNLALASLHRFRSEHDLADRLVERAAVNPAMTTIATWAAELVQSPVGGLLVEIRKQSAYAALASRTQAFAIESEAMPKVVVGGEINAAFIAEGAPKNVYQGSLAVLTLTPKKLASIAVLSEEMLNYAVNAQATLRQLMSAGIAETLDATFFGTAASSAAAPAGILNGISATTASAATPATAAAVADLRALMLAIEPATDPVFIAAPARAMYLSSILPPGFSIPVLASSALPADRVIAVDASGLVAAHSTDPRFSASGAASLHMEDTTPLALGTGTQGSGVLAVPLRSTYQTDSIAIKAILWVAWAIRSGGVSYVDAGW